MPPPAKRWPSGEYLTIDTEFLRETTFWPQLCLIQMAGPDIAVIVDPLAKGIDLAPFFELMADTDVVKVFHAARQDIEIIYNLGKLIPHPIFDTQVAAMVCGFGDSVSYDQLVSRIKNVHIDKSSRFTDWSRRPLSEKQLDYALADVTHLRDVYLHLKAELEREGRSLWLTEEMAILEAKRNLRHPSGRCLAAPEDAAEEAASNWPILQKVAAWREREARSRNVPRGRILKDDATLRDRPAAAEGRRSARRACAPSPRAGSARQPARQSSKPSMPRSTLPKADMPKLPRQNQAPEGASAAVEMLKVLLKLIAEKQGVAAKIIANSDDLERIAVEGAKADVGALKGWRRELFGDTALKLINGEVALRFVDRKIEAVEL